MTSPNAVRPATATTVNGPKENACLGRLHSSFSENPRALQEIRMRHLARRFALAPAMARAVADLAFSEVSR
jgi:hypothetical protein